MVSQHQSPQEKEEGEFSVSDPHATTIITTPRHTRRQRWRQQPLGGQPVLPVCPQLGSSLASRPWFDQGNERRMKMHARNAWEVNLRGQAA